MAELNGNHNPAAPPKRGLLFRSLKHRNFRLFFSGQAISMTGTWMQMAAGGWLAYQLTNDMTKSAQAFWLGVVAFASRLPTFLLAPFNGVMVDRWNRRKVVIVTQALAMVQALALAGLTLAGWITLPQYVALALVLGVINSMDIPARQSFMIEMLDEPGDLNNAIALNSSLVNGSRIVGPSVASVILATVGAGVCFLVNGLSYIAVLAALLMMTVRPQPRRARPGGIVESLKEGFNYVRGFAPIRDILLLLALVSVMGASFDVLLPIFAGKVLNTQSGAIARLLAAVGAKDTAGATFGLLLAARGAGALVGAISLARRESVRGLGRWIGLAPAIFGAAMVAMGLSRWVWLSMLVMPVAGFGMLTQMASSNTVLQTIVDDDKRGRVMSFYSMAFMGMIPLGSLFAGGLASQIGAPRTVIIGGVGCIVGSVLFTLRLPALRKLARPVYVSKGIIPGLAAGLAAATESPLAPETNNNHSSL